MTALLINWIRPSSHAWVDEPLKQVVMTWVRAFAAEHPWVRSMEVEERFADNGINVRLTPPLRPGIPQLILRCVRDRDSRTFEVALPFAMGNEHPTEGLLDAARLAFRAQEKNSR